MIDTDDTGQKKLQELVANIEDNLWNDYEKNFLERNQATLYRGLTPKQKGLVSSLYDKLIKR